MLIHSRFKIFRDDTLQLPTWIRAPAGLKEGVIANMTLTQFDQFSSQLTISPVDHRCWSDLWLIEIQCFETEGLMRKVVSILDDLEINIVYISSCRIKEGNEHFFSVLADCRKYYSDIDGLKTQRTKLDNPDLIELRAELVLRLIDNISFHDGKQPNISIKRLNSYSQISNNLINQSYPSIKQRKISRGKISLDYDMVKAIRESCQCSSADELFYEIFIDTSERMVRVNFFRQSDNLYIFRIHFDESSKIMESILGVVEEGDFDILGCQMNYAPTIYEKLAEIADESQRFASIDLALRSHRPAPPDRKALIKKIVGRMADRHPGLVILDEQSLEIN